MATQLNFRWQDGTDKIRQALREFERGSKTFSYNGHLYDLSNPRILMDFDAIGEEPRNLRILPANDNQFPDASTMSNIVVWRGAACCFCGSAQLWSLELSELRWHLVNTNRMETGYDIDLTTQAGILRIPRGSSDVLELTQFLPTRPACFRLLISRFLVAPFGDASQSLLSEPSISSLRLDPDANGTSQGTPPSINPFRLDLSPIGNSLGPRGLPLASSRFAPAVETPSRIYTARDEVRDKIAALLEAESKNDFRSLIYNRSCAICFVENPLERAAFTACGHVTCHACALTLSIKDAADDAPLDHPFLCPFCRKATMFVKLFEQLKDESNKSSTNDNIQ